MESMNACGCSRASREETSPRWIETQHISLDVAPGALGEEQPDQ